MASNNGGGEQQSKKTAELGKPLKEGERIVAPTRRPDGTLRKPIRIRAGYVPQEEVAIYQSKGALVCRLRNLCIYVLIIFMFLGGYGVEFVFLMCILSICLCMGIDGWIV